MSWTKPFHGVQHYQPAPGRLRPQYTVEDYGSFVVAYMLGLTGFTPVREKQFDTVNETKRWIERISRDIGI